MTRYVCLFDIFWVDLACTNKVTIFYYVYLCKHYYVFFHPWSSKPCYFYLSCNIKVTVKLSQTFWFVDNALIFPNVKRLLDLHFYLIYLLCRLFPDCMYVA